MKTSFFFVTILFFLGSCIKKEQNLMVQTEIKKGWMFRQSVEGEWMPAIVPGTVHTDLMANGKIKDPFYRLNEHDVQWVDKVDWEYKTVFSIDKNTLERDRLELNFKGLDTYAEVSINGQKVLTADNMFREWKADVKNALKEGDNELHILLKSPIKEGIKKYDANSFVIPVSGNDLAEIGQVEGKKMVSVYTRKAGYHFGWDWGPRLVTSGIWRPVFLNAWDNVKIENLQIVQNSVSEKKAEFNAVYEINSVEPCNATLSVVSDSTVFTTSKVKLSKGINKYSVDFKIDNPKLWWTNGLGVAHLYNIEGILKTGGRSISEKTRIGVRTLELVREKDSTGTSFYFKLNGYPVFMKGANYIPNDVFLPRVNPENYRKVIETARNSNNNMLRVWGGGVYEEDLFYDLCDEAGILIWQDFMFACAMFPGDDAFLANVKHEAIDNVKRLRNHPSLALWCGNNEILAAWFGWGWKQAEEAKSKENADKIWKAYQDIFHKTLPEVVQEFDPHRSYWDSSPCSGMGIKADLVNGDEHYWGVWWGKEPFSTYATHLARFMSEYGFQSFPEIATVRKYALPEDYDIFSEVMKSHQRSSIGNGTIEYYMLHEYKKPKDFESFLYVNHVLQAEGIKFGLEGHRRAMPWNMGSLYWQINDVWPVASWSSTDYYQKWKALQYYVKKGFEPVLVSPYFKDEKLKVAVVNDKLESIEAVLNLRLMDFSGNVAWNKESSITIPANSSTDFFEVDKSEFLVGMDSKSLVFVCGLEKGGNVVSKNTIYFKPFKELVVPAPNVEYTVSKSGSGYDIALRTDKLAKNIYLQIEDEEGFFSDNYFDLLPGESLIISLKTAISEEKLKEVLKIRTLDDAF
jgi:beta-mannosidase